MTNDLNRLKTWDWYYLIIFLLIGILIGATFKMHYLNTLNENQCNHFICENFGNSNPACNQYTLKVIEPSEYNEEYIKMMDSSFPVKNKTLI